MFRDRVLRVSIAAAVVIAGLLISLAAPVAVAVVAGVAAAVSVHNLHLDAELSRRIEEIRGQAAELAASRDRAVAGQDVREIAYAIHPPVLADRGLLEAIEAQSSRLALPMAVRADPRLRGVRFGEQIEATAWYVLAEALSNVVKHAGASEVQVSLSREDGRLGLVIRDDGRGFDLDRPRGLGLTSLSDRLDTVGGSLTINSGAGLGTSVCVHIPVGHDQQSGVGQVAGRERVDA